MMYGGYMATVDQQEAARQALRSWRRRADAVEADRDQLVITAIAKAGLSKEELPTSSPG